MKKLLVFLFTLACFAVNAQTKVTAPLTRNSVLDNTYGTHYDTLGYGGFMVVANLTNRDAIPAAQRKKGMIVAVDTAIYQLTTGITNADWQLKSASPDNGISIVGNNMGLGGSLVRNTSISVNGNSLNIFGDIGHQVIFAPTYTSMVHQTGVSGANPTTVFYQTPSVASMVGTTINARDSVSFYARSNITAGNTSSESVFIASHYPTSNDILVSPPAILPDYSSKVEVSRQGPNATGLIELYSKTVYVNTDTFKINTTRMPSGVNYVLTDPNGNGKLVMAAQVGGGGGGMSAITVATANGFAGSSSGGATPALTLTTPLTGMLKGNGSAMLAATQGTDYSNGTSALGTGILKSTTGTGALSIAVAGDFPLLNQNTSGTASNLSGTPLLPNGTTAAVQALHDSTGKLATTSFILRELGSLVKDSTLVESASSSILEITHGALRDSLGLMSQAQNLVLAGPTSGSAIPTFRALTLADLPPGVGGGSYVDLTTSQVVQGLKTWQGSVNSDSGPLGSEMVNTTGSGTNWSGNLSTGATHTVGSTVAYTTTIAAAATSFYQITYTITGRTAGSIVINFGGITTSTITASGATGPQAISTGALSVTPTTDFDGTVVLSIKPISNSTATMNWASSSGTVVMEMRALASNTNTSIGINALKRNTTATNNTAIGNSALASTTTGGTNVGIGLNTYSSNTTGSNNVGIGSSAGTANLTGVNNTAIGTSALRNNTGGASNVAIGNDAGRYIADAVTANVSINQGTYIGAMAKALASGQTNSMAIGYNTTDIGSNSTVIGNNSVTVTALGTSSSFLVGTQTDVASSVLTMASTTRGFLPPRMTTTNRDAIASPATGLVLFDNSANALSSYDGTRWTYGAKFLTTSVILDFPSTTATTVSDLTVTVTGAADGDPVIVGVPNGSTTATSMFRAWVSAPNTVTVRFSPKGTEDPASGTFKVTVSK